ncbi:MAG: hypothetical protein COA47_02585 [Robiginitomaculum sp.]|nr:MAG: hypothetical protein COA47_02585 [Robiginitomaculum sp.]
MDEFEKKTNEKPVRPAQTGSLPHRALRVSILHFLEFVALLMAIFLVVFGAIAWQLSKGPFNLEVFKSDAQSALVQVFGGAEATIDQLEAGWSEAEKAIVIVAKGVRISDGQGQIILRVPRFEAGLDGLSLLRRKLVFSRLVAVGGEVSVVRRSTGDIGVGIGSVAQVLANRSVWQQKPGIEGSVIRRAVTQLQVLSIRDGILNLEDQRSGISWRAPNARLSFQRVGDRVSFSAEGVIESNGQQSQMQFEGSARENFSNLSATASFANVNPAQLVPATGPLAMLNRIEAPVSAAISIATGEDGLLTVLDIDLTTGSGQFVLPNRQMAIDGAMLQASFDAADGILQIDTARFTGGGSELDLTGTISGMDPARLVVGESIEFDLKLEPVSLDMSGFLQGQLELDRLEIAGQVLPGTRQMLLANWAMTAGDLFLSGDGEIKWVPIADTVSWFPKITLNGRSGGTTNLAQVLAFWPVNLAEGVRSWAKNNMSQAILHDFELSLKTDERLLDAGGLTNDMLKLSFSFEQVETTYFGTMPPLKSAVGTAILLGNRFDVQVSSATLLSNELSDGFVNIPFLHPKGAVAVYGATARGDLSDILTLLDHEPFGYPSQYRIDPVNVTGTGTVKFELRRPMRTRVPFRDMGFLATGTYTDVDVAGFAFGQDLSGLNVAFKADENGMSLEGDGLIGGRQSSYLWQENFKAVDEPRTNFAIDTQIDAVLFDEMGLPTRDFFSGKIGLHVEMIGNGLAVQNGLVKADLTDALVNLPGPGWEKPEGAPGWLSFRVTQGADDEFNLDQLELIADGLDIQGRILFSTQTGLQLIELTRAKMEGAFDFTAKVNRDDTGGFVLDADVAEADISGLVRGFVNRGNTSFSVPLKADIRMQRTIAGERLLFSTARLQLDQSTEQINSMQFVGNSDQGDHQFTLTRDQSDRLAVQASSPDGGAVVQALFGVQGLSGGILSLRGFLADDPKTASEFILNLENFALNNTPVVAQILSLGSLRGLSDTLSGSGMSFTEMEVPIQNKEGLMQIRGARATGPAMGVTLDGDINMIDRDLQIRGTLAPAYTLNSILGALPVLGNILVPREGEGVFGLTYSVGGSFDEMQVSVNPLSAFAPGVLRQMFGGRLPDIKAADPTPEPEPTKP